MLVLSVGFGDNSSSWFFRVFDLLISDTNATLTSSALISSVSLLTPYCINSNKLQNGCGWLIYVAMAAIFVYPMV